MTQGEAIARQIPTVVMDTVDRIPTVLTLGARQALTLKQITKSTTTTTKATDRSARLWSMIPKKSADFLAEVMRQIKEK